MAAFKAIVIEKAESGTKAALTDFDEANLMDGDVTVRVEYSTVNYKDGLALTGKAPVVRRFPMIPGIDFAGTVEASSHPAWKPGDKVILNGWGCGETHHGGYAGKARVKGDWLVKLPASMSADQAMAIGTAGYTAMLAVMAAGAPGLDPSRGDILVTGAAAASAASLSPSWPSAASDPAATGRTDRGRLPERPGRRRDHRAHPACRSARSRSPGSAGRAPSTPSARPPSPTCSR